jgi:hypothetical protein
MCRADGPVPRHDHSDFAGSFQFSRRRENLTWAHHRISIQKVAHLTRDGGFDMFRILPAFCPTVAEPEIVVMPGNPLVIGHAPRARTISAAFLNSYNDHFNKEGQGIFAKIYKDYPVDYFWGLITLAKVMKIEIGEKAAAAKC